MLSTVYLSKDADSKKEFYSNNVHYNILTVLSLSSISEVLIVESSKLPCGCSTKALFFGIETFFYNPFEQK